MNYTKVTETIESETRPQQGLVLNPKLYDLKPKTQIYHKTLEKRTGEYMLHISLVRTKWGGNRIVIVH